MSNGGTDIAMFVSPDAVFPGLEDTEDKLVDILSELSRDDVLFVCARINTIVCGFGDPDIKGRQERVLHWLCTDEQIDNINSLARRNKHSGLLRVFFRGQLLELMRWASRHCRNLPRNGETFSDLEVRTAFVQAALIAGMLWSKRVYGQRLSGDGEIGTVRRRALSALRKGVEEGNVTPDPDVTIGRGWSLFTHYLPRHFESFANEIYAATDMSVEQYLTCATGLSIYSISNRPEGSIFDIHSVGSATEYRDIFPKFIALESQTPEQLKISLWENFDTHGYRSLREQPIMVVEDGRAIILDPVFFAEKISIGPLFRIVTMGGRRSANEIFGAFGLAFEDYAADILKRMYPTRPGLIDRVSFGARGSNREGHEFEVDASLVDASSAAVFEMKAAWLREDAVLGADPENFVNHVRTKYGAAVDAAERDKGVAQLARIMNAISQGEWLGEMDEFADTGVLYPVLVVHDPRMDAPAFGEFLDHEFQAILSPVSAARRVAPLIVMTINDLENLESSVEEFSFAELLATYDREHPDRLRSLHNFLAFSEYANRINRSRYLAKTATEIMERVQHDLFPQTGSNATS